MVGVFGDLPSHSTSEGCLEVESNIVATASLCDSFANEGVISADTISENVDTVTGEERSVEVGSIVVNPEPRRGHEPLDLGWNLPTEVEDGRLLALRPVQ